MDRTKTPTQYLVRDFGTGIEVRTDGADGETKCYHAGWLHVILSLLVDLFCNWPDRMPPEFERPDIVNTDKGRFIVVPFRRAKTVYVQRLKDGDEP